MREIRLSGLEGGGAKPIVSPYPYLFFTASLASGGRPLVLAELWLAIRLRGIASPQTLKSNYGKPEAFRTEGGRAAKLCEL